MCQDSELWANVALVISYSFHVLLCIFILFFGQQKLQNNFFLNTPVRIHFPKEALLLASSSQTNPQKPINLKYH